MLGINKLYCLELMRIEIIRYKLMNFFIKQSMKHEPTVNISKYLKHNSLNPSLNIKYELALLSCTYISLIFLYMHC